MSATVERLSTSEVEIRVSVPWSEMEDSYRRSLSKVRGSIQVRGFRKGKVPQAMVEKMVGEQVMREVAIDHVGGKVQELIREQKILPLGVPLDLESKVVLGEDRVARLETRVEVLPMIDRIAFDGLELQPRREVTAEDVTERITLIAARKAPLERALVGREAGPFDQVVLEGEARFKGAEETVEPVKDLQVDLAPWTEPPPALAEQLAGKKVGDSGEVELVLPRPRSEQGPRLASLSYRVCDIVRRVIPPIDDDLARDFDMESLAELEGAVRETLEKETFDEYVMQNGDAILEQLASKVAFDLPPSYRPPDAPGGQDDKARERSEQVATLYDRFARRNLLSMLIAFQNGLKLPEEAMTRASDQMRRLIDEQEGSQREKDEAYAQWRREFEQGMFTRILSSFLVQEVEKSLGIEPEASPARPDVQPDGEEPEHEGPEDGET